MLNSCGEHLKVAKVWLLACLLIAFRCYFCPDIFCPVVLVWRVTGTGTVASFDVSGIPWALVDELAH